MIEKGPFIYRVFLIIFWVGTCFGFVAEELFPPLNGLKSIVFLLIDMCVLLLAIMTLKEKWHKVSLLIFFGIAFLSTILLSKYSVVVFLNGCRDFFGLLFILPIAFYLYRTNNQYGFVDKFNKHLKYFLYVQCFCTVWQYFKYGAGDYVGGSLGCWNSGVLSMVIYMTSFYLMNKNFDRNHYWQSLKSDWIYIFLLYPTFLNETKASFIYLLFYFILLSKIEFKTVLKFLVLSPVIVACFVGLFYVYSLLTAQDFDELTGTEFYEEYLVGEDPDELVDVIQAYYEGEFDKADYNQWNTDIPRFTKITLLSRVLEDSKGGIVFGEGVGQMKGSTLLKKTRFADNYSWYIDGTRTWLMTCILQIGIIGFLWFMVVLIKSLGFWNSDGIYFINVKLYLLMFAIFMFIYNDAFSNIIFCLFYFYIATSTIQIENKEFSNTVSCTTE